MREAAGGAGTWRMDRRRADAHSAVGKGLHLVELSRRGLDAGRSRPKARSHLGFTRPRGGGLRFQHHPRRARLETAVRPRAGDRDARGVSCGQGSTYGPHPEERRRSLSSGRALRGPVGRVSKDGSRASWFETAQARLLTMRDKHRTYPACMARAAALWLRISSVTSRPAIAPSLTAHLPATMTRSARCAPHSTSAANGSPCPEKRNS